MRGIAPFKVYLEDIYMAYKFQLGAFTASGSIKAEEGFDADEKNITNVR